jgi:hypothetical protein
MNVWHSKRFLPPNHQNTKLHQKELSHPGVLQIRFAAPVKSGYLVTGIGTEEDTYGLKGTVQGTKLVILTYPDIGKKYPEGTYGFLVTGGRVD